MRGEKAVVETGYEIRFGDYSSSITATDADLDLIIETLITEPFSTSSPLFPLASLIIVLTSYIDCFPPASDSIFFLIFI